MDEVPEYVAERRYERWVMRAAELVWGDYPDDREEAERVLLVRMQDGFVGSVPPRDFLGEEESTLEEVGEYFSDYGDDHVEAACSLISALYSAAGGDEWSLVVKPEGSGTGLAVSVRGVSLDVEGAWVNLTVDPNSFACRDASDLRALHERIIRKLPRRQITVEEAAEDALEAVEEMQGTLEDVREVSDVLDTQEEMRHVRVALENLWMVLAGIAAVEEDRRLRGEDGESGEEGDLLEP
jgi:GNAT superfamily N-acetyltransferase